MRKRAELQEWLAEALCMVYDLTGVSNQRNQMLAIHLLAIMHSAEIRQSGLNANELVRRAGLPRLGPTMNAGIKLSKHVELEPEAIQHLRSLCGLSRG